MRKQTAKRGTSILPLALLVIAIISWASVLISWMQSSLAVPPKKVVQQVMDRGIPAREIELFPDNLQHEAFFETLANCVPTEEAAVVLEVQEEQKKKKKKCGLYVPENGIERIAILSPPGAVGYVFEKFIDEVIRLHATPEQLATMEFVKTPHSLPYGYGKTHGYTKVIRLATLPLLLAASDLVLEQSLHTSIAADDITLLDITQATQQVVRWHCRVSHVAAHTAVLTVSLEDLLDDPWEEEYQIRSFLNLVPAAAANTTTEDGREVVVEENGEEKHIDEDELAGSMDEIVHRSTLLLMRLDQLRLAAASNTRKKAPKMEDLLDTIVNHELSSTNNLDAWPCTSFWKFEDTITPLSKKTAQMFAPNCTAPYTKCFVQRDHCEEHGDVKCSPKNKK